MSSSWTKKLEKKLATLPQNASDESIQTVANWITFNRKHAATIASVLAEKLRSSDNNNPSSNSNKQLYWSLVHFILTSEKDNPGKWEKLVDLRIAVGEALVSVLETAKDLPDSLDSYLKQWTDMNAFGGPSLSSQLKRVYQNNKSGGGGASGSGIAGADASSAIDDEASSTKVAAPPSIASYSTAQETQASEQEETASTSPPASDTASASVKSPSTTTETPTTTSTQQQKRSSFSQNNNNQAVEEYDFESKNVPARKVETKEFLEPCKAIATLQIARDLRSDKHNEISASIAALPEDVLETCRDMQNGGVEELEEDKIKDFSYRIPSTLLDLNMTEECTQLSTFQDILQQQIQARKKLVKLLLESRCQFGSHVAAKDYLEMDGEITEKLKKCKQLLSDALELEGLDTSQIEEESRKKKSKGDSDEKELQPLAWYNPDGALPESESKKQRVE